MSGHSKWSTIKRAKAVTDAKRGAVFTKIGNIITIAAREKGGDPDSNPSLRMAIDKARSANMPKDNIERAIKRGTGELAGDVVEELYYEGVLPGNIQVIIKSLTDNKNRSASVIRHALSKHGGSLGSVMWNFDQKGVILLSLENIKSKNIEIDNLQLELIELSIDDFMVKDDSVIILSAVEDLQKIKDRIEEMDLKVESADIEYVAKTKQVLGGEDSSRLEKFAEVLDELEDVSDYYFNVDF